MKFIGWVVALFLLFFGGIGVVSWYLSPDDLRGCPESPDDTTVNCSKADAIVAISGGDTEARTAEAIALYGRGWADTLIFSGAAYDSNSPSNARAMRAQAIEAGVPESHIEIEEHARDTRENAKRTLTVASQRGAKQIILVTSAYHQRRAGIEFRQTFGNVRVVDHPVVQDDHWSRSWWMTPNGWWLAIGELAKIIFTLAKGV